MRLSERVTAVELCLREIGLFASDHHHNLPSLHGQLILLRQQMRSLVTVLVDSEQVQIIKDILLHLQRYINIVNQSEKYAAIINEEVDFWFSQINTDVGQLLLGLKKILATSDPEIPDLNSIHFDSDLGSTSPASSLNRELKSVLSSLTFGDRKKREATSRVDPKKGAVVQRGFADLKRQEPQLTAVTRKESPVTKDVMDAVKLNHCVEHNVDEAGRASLVDSLVKTDSSDKVERRRRKSSLRLSTDAVDTVTVSHCAEHNVGEVVVAPVVDSSVQAESSEKVVRRRRGSSLRLSPLQKPNSIDGSFSDNGVELLFDSITKEKHSMPGQGVGGACRDLTAIEKKYNDIVDNNINSNISDELFTKRESIKSVQENDSNLSIKRKNVDAIKSEKKVLPTRRYGGLKQARQLFAKRPVSKLNRSSLHLQPKISVEGARDSRLRRDGGSQNAGAGLSGYSSQNDISFTPIVKGYRLGSECLSSGISTGIYSETSSAIEGNALPVKVRRSSWCQRAHNAVIDWSGKVREEVSLPVSVKTPAVGLRSNIESSRWGLRPPDWMKSESVESLGVYTFTETSELMTDQLCILLHDSSYKKHSTLAYIAKPGGVARFVIEDARNLDLFILNLKGLLCNPACLLTGPAKTRVISQMDEIYDKLKSGYCTQCELDLTLIFNQMDESIFEKSCDEIFSTVLLQQYIERYYEPMEAKLCSDAGEYKENDFLPTFLWALYSRIESLQSALQSKGLCSGLNDESLILKGLSQADLKHIVREGYAIEEKMLTVASRHSKFALQAACFRYFYIVPVLEKVVRFQERQKHDPLYADLFGLRYMAERIGAAKNIALFFRFMHQSLPSKEGRLSEKSGQLTQLKGGGESALSQTTGFTLFSRLQQHPGVKRQGFERLVATVSGRRYLLLKASQSYKETVTDCWWKNHRK